MTPAVPTHSSVAESWCGTIEDRAVRCALFFGWNTVAGVVLIWLAINRARGLRPVLARLAVAILLAWVLPCLLPPPGKRPRAPPYQDY
jgi:hypothetical protein